VSHLFQAIGWVITVEDWALVLRLHLAEHESMRSVAVRRGIPGTRSDKRSAPTVRRPMCVRRRSPGSSLWVRRSVRCWGRAHGSQRRWSESVWAGPAPAWFRENVARSRPECAPADPADRISYEPRDHAQCDLWFPEVRIPVGLVRAPDFAGVGDGVLAFAVRHQHRNLTKESKGVVERANP
jgi:hypothetical protein